MFTRLRSTNALRRQDTAAEVVFSQERGSRDHRKGSDPRTSSFSQLLKLFTWTVAAAWISWVTAEILLWQCGENPQSIACLVKMRTFSTGDSPHLFMSDYKRRSDALHDIKRMPRNFAAGGDGALVFMAFTSPTFSLPAESGNVLSKRPSPVPPSAILDDNVAIGRCWEFTGQRGHVGIRLNERVHIKSVSLDNVHPSLVTSTSAHKTPRDFSLWVPYEGPSIEGLPTELRPASHFLVSKPFPPGISATSQFVLLVNSSYNISASNTRQAFDVPPLYEGIPIPPNNFVILEISSNWGASSTCVYSIGIHGDTML